MKPIKSALNSISFFCLLSWRMHKHLKCLYPFPFLLKLKAVNKKEYFILAFISTSCIRVPIRNLKKKKKKKKKNRKLRCHQTFHSTPLSQDSSWQGHDDLCVAQSGGQFSVFILLLLLAVLGVADASSPQKHSLPLPDTTRSRIFTCSSDCSLLISFTGFSPSTPIHPCSLHAEPWL